MMLITIGLLSRQTGKSQPPSTAAHPERSPQDHSPIIVPEPARPGLIAVTTSVAEGVESGVKAGQAYYARDHVTFQSGSVSLRFLLGVDVDLVGPVDLELVSPKRAILHRGQLTADVDPSAHGFTIETPHADIIDLGTKFGVNVQESGKADVVVFEGRVDINYKHRELQKAKARYDNLKMGEAIHIEGYGKFHRIPMVRSTGSATNWSTKIEDARSRYVSTVSDNFPPGSRPIYYSLVAGGFDEDALSYVDRPYEWNSLPDVPFPEPLRGGDYIRLMNDLKFVMNLEVSIGLKQPADVYVLMDHRASPPAWLVRSFTKTRLQIGIDEHDPRQIYSWDTVDGPRALGVGPGQSVDRAFDIWVRHCETAGNIVLGSLVEPVASNQKSEPVSSPAPVLRAGLSMYGVVITSFSSSAVDSSPDRAAFR